ncbi:hypothetical protein FA13DRAFT_1798667 [Coprinellus micaceus]|uniref:Uncharacterized protein n=1 Tax=Coprinellus micaceus TaxID=71717 RepID=A0A4Y7SM47_COPMI|nr:hypothetical protein FA13DRAFT_1798667 [Coprinellus micaceus]
MAAYISVKLESNIGTEDIVEMGNLPTSLNDRPWTSASSRSLVAFENHTRLVHLDRTGSQITPPIDIHRHPATFL